MKEKWDIAVLGAGPGGYAAALRASQLKKKVVLVEKDKIGGTCINYGCIPTKYLIHQAKLYEEFINNSNLEGPSEKMHLNWKKIQNEKDRVVNRLVKGIEFLLKRNGVDVIKGEAHLKDERHLGIQKEDETRVIEFDRLILAAGSSPSALPFLIPNQNEIITSQQALQLKAIPSKMLVVGAGAVGLEIGSIYQKLGCEVTILEIMPTILPGAEEELVTRLERILKSQHLNIYTQMKIKEAHITKGKVKVKGIGLKDQKPFELEAEKVLLAAGRSPRSEQLNRKGLHLDMDDSGFVKVNPYLQTGTSGIYAIGDLIGGRLLAHKASHEGIVAAENTAGEKKTLNYQSLPMAVYTEPEFSSVGLTEKEAKKKENGIQVGIFSLQASGRALTLGKKEGMVKIVADKKDRIIGAHILSPHASELIAEMALAVHKGLRLQDISTTMHVHPTLSEAMMEAAMKAKSQAIHVLNQ